MKKFIITKIFILLIFSMFIFNSCIENNQNTESYKAELHFFWGEGCPHCENQKPFLTKMDEKYPELKINMYEIYKNTENKKLMDEMNTKLNADARGVPFTVVGDNYTIGWGGDNTTGKQLEEYILEAIK